MPTPQPSAADDPYLESIVQKMIDADLPEDQIGQNIKEYHRLKAAGGTFVESEAGDTPLRAAVKGFQEGAARGGAGFVRGVERAPLEMVKGVGSLLSHSPEETLRGMVEGVENLPSAVMSAGARPEEFGQSVGNIVGQEMLAPTVPSAVRLGAKVPGRIMEAARANPEIAGAVAGGLIYPGGIKGAIGGALGGGYFGRALKKSGQTAEDVAAGAEEADVLSPQQLKLLKKQGYKDSDIDLFRRSIRREAQTRIPTSVPSHPTAAPALRVAPSGTAADVAARARANAFADVRGLPAGKPPIITEPPPDPSGITVTRAARGDLPVRDPVTGRMKRVFTSESAGEAPSVQPVPSHPTTATPAAPSPMPASAPPLSTEVQRLTKEGYGAEEIADQLKDHPDLRGASSRTARINLVREARGGQAGQIPARAKQAIDQALSQLKTADQKRAYLLKAPNAVVFDYVKTKLGL